MGAPLEGLRVVELGHVMAGPVCGRMLADLGADVVKIEPPGGDPTRSFASEHGGVGSAPFDMLNRGKRGLVIDLKQEEGAGLARRLLASVDVIIENFRPGTMEGLGLGYDRLRAGNPRLIYCAVTGFGAAGPLAELGGFDLIAQGMTGLMSITGEGPGRPPTKCGPPLTDITAGILAALGVLAALQARHRSGEGQRVESSLYQAGVFQTLWHSALSLATGRAPEPLGSAHPLAAPYQAFPTADGWITVGGSSEAAWRRLVQALDDPGLESDPRFADNGARMANRDALAELLADRFQADATEVWLDRLSAAGVPAGPVSSVPEMLGHAQTRALGMVLDLDDGTTTLGCPVGLSDAPPARPSPAPALGAHTDEVLASAGLSPAEIARLREAGAIR